VTVQGGLINRDNTAANIGRIDNWGLITLTGDWTNNSSGNAFINSSPGTTELPGAAQTITGTTTTNFYNLTLSGSGIKTLNINTIVEGSLSLNDRELATQGNWIHVTNPAVNAITRTGGMNSTPVQGFVSSTGTGRLRRNTNSTGSYLFPVGSSQGSSARFRPVALTPTDGSLNTYAVRFVNNDPTIDGYPVTLKDANIGAVNPYWYQKINGLSGTTHPDITLYFDNIVDNIPPLPSTILTQWAYNAPPVQWRAISGVTVSGAGSPVLSSVTKAAWISFTTENFDLAPQSIPLPVELTSFTATCFPDLNQISWSTASEVNNDYFVLERSTDGISFTEVIRISGAGTTTQWSHYTFEDRDVSPGESMYYRLTQYDFDGDSEISRMIHVDCAGTTGAGATVVIYPNPVTDELHIVVNQSHSVKGRVKIVNLLGQEVFAAPLDFEPGLQQFRVDVKSIAAGMYSVILNCGSEDEAYKIVKTD
jgi:hypothetical protein